MQLIQTVLILIQTYAACSSILRGPSSGTYSTGNNIKLTCITDKSDTIVWQNDKQTTIFVGDVRFETDEKYNNFFVNTTEGQSTMIITHVQVDDEGEYSCHVSNIDFAKAFVKIEDPPEVTMFIGGKETDEPLTSTIFITCRAEGARPKVSIRFQIEGHEWLKPTIQNTTMYNMLFDTIATVYFNSSDNLNGATVTCQSVGHEIIPHINETQTLYTPVCSFVTVKTDATCKCSANPPVHKYVLSVDGVLLEGQNLTLKDHYGSTVSCLGVNAIGIGESDTIYIDSNGTPLIPLYIVFVCILVIIVLGTSIWGIRKLLGRKKIAFNVENQVSIKTPENHCTGVPMNTSVTTYPRERHSMEHEDVSSNCAVDLMSSSTCGRIKSPEDKIVFGPAFTCADSLTKDVKHEEISVKMKSDEFKLKRLVDKINAAERGLSLDRTIPNEPNASRSATSMPDYRVSYITLDHGDNHNNFLGIHKQENKTVYATITHNDKIVQRQQGLETSSK